MMIGTKRLVSKATIISLALGLLCGCSGEKSNNTVLNKFEVNEYTVSTDYHTDTVTDKTNSGKDNTESDKSNSDKPKQNIEDSMGELVMENTDDSVAYDVSNDTDVSYKGTTYYGLYSCVNSLNTKYDKNTIINFIIKNIKMTSKEVYCQLSTDEGDASEADNFSIDDELSGRPKYEELKSKYNEPATWTLTLINSDDKSIKVIFGSYSYMLLSGVDSDVVLDMSK